MASIGKEILSCVPTVLSVQGQISNANSDESVVSMSQFKARRAVAGRKATSYAARKAA